MPPTHPEYIAAKAHFEATKAWTRPVIARATAAANSYLEAVYAWGDLKKRNRACGGCLAEATEEARQLKNERYAIYKPLIKPARDAAAAFNAALERWDRARDVGAVNY